MTTVAGFDDDDMPPRPGGIDSERPRSISNEVRPDGTLPPVNLDAVLLRVDENSKQRTTQSGMSSARKGSLLTTPRPVPQEARGDLTAAAEEGDAERLRELLEAHPDGTYDVRYDDGRYVDEEQRVERRYIRKRGERASEAERDIDEAGGGGGADALRAAESYGEQRLPHMPGDRVEVRLACAHVGAPQGPAHSDSHVARIREAKEKREEVERSLNVAK